MNTLTEKALGAYERFFNKNNDHTFSLEAKIKIRNEMEEDISTKIIEISRNKIILPVYKFTRAHGNQFIIEIEEDFKEDYEKLSICFPQSQPEFGEDHVDHPFYIVIKNKRYPCKDIRYFNIPVSFQITLGSFILDLLDSSYVRIFTRYKSLMKSGKTVTAMKYNKQARDIYNINPDEFGSALAIFFEAFNDYLSNHFRKILDIKSEKELSLRSAELIYKKLTTGFPQPNIKGVLTYNYDYTETPTFYFKIRVNQEHLIKTAKRIWNKTIKNLPKALKK